MNILITSAGQRVSLVRFFQKELKKQFADAKVFTTDMCPRLSAACTVSDKYFQVPKVTDEHYIQQLLQLSLEQNIKMIVPTIDTELPILSSNKEKFSQAGIHLIISDMSFIRQCRDKRLTHSFFNAAGIHFPKPVSKYEPTFPMFIKPYDGSLSVDTYIVKSKEDLLCSHLNNERFIFMEYLDKLEHDEYTADMYYGKDNTLKCIVPRKRLHVRAGEINKGITCKNEIVPYLKSKLAYIPGAIGCLTMQVFLHNFSGKITAIEINPRFGGGYPLSYHAGANYPKWLINEYYNNESIPYIDEWEDQLLMLRYDNEIIVHAN